MSATVSAREQFDRQAAQYNERWASWSDETLRRLLEMANPSTDMAVLDIATGTGFTALAFAPHVLTVVGTDVSPGMLAQAAKRAEAAGADNVQWVEAPAESQPFPDGAFDLVTSRIAPHHFPDPAAFVREVVRVLRPGGVFVLGDTTVPDDDPEAAAWQNAVEKVRDPSHGRNLPPSEWRALCEAAGLRVTDSDHLSGAIEIALPAWLETAGCTGECAETVQRMFAEAPEGARAAFRVRTDPETGETRFAWQRVLLRAEKPISEDGGASSA
jgi:Methylase involved in ubiquinone/menaquinone biosynthesis